jgi:S-adenosyl-L-methionine hydrolase (adenosine-forming)
MGVFYPKMSTKPNPTTPVITLTSDFGLADAYVAAMKAAILRQAPNARLIDVSHQIPPQDILFGAIVLERAIDAFDPGTIHLAVVDPGVGTARKILIAQIHSQTIICPDNGLITWTWRKWKGGRVRELTWRPRQPSRTFHGRDIMAPAAGMLAAGKSLESIARKPAKPILLPQAPMKRGADTGEIIYIDHFGNCMTNIPRTALASPRCNVLVGEINIGRIRKTYSDVEIGQPLALFGSADLLEIAVRGASAARELRLRIGDEVRLQ